MVGGLKYLVKETKGLYYLFSETKVLSSGGVIAELIHVFISHMQIIVFLPFFVYLFFILLFILYENLAYP